MHQVHDFKKEQPPSWAIWNKIHVVGCFDPLRPSRLSTATSCVSYSQGEVGSILGALEVTYTPEKIILTKVIYGLQLLLLKKFYSTHPTRGSLSKI